MVKNKLIIGCVCSLFLSVIIIVITFTVYTTYKDKHLFYVEGEDIYVQTDRNSGGDSAYVYFGKTKNDIIQKKDYFCIIRDNDLNSYIEFIIKKGCDSIFLIKENSNDVRICKTTNFRLVKHHEQREEVRIYNSFENPDSYSIGHLPDKEFLRRFKEKPNDYSVFFFYWSEFWHEPNNLWKSNAFPTKGHPLSDIAITPQDEAL